jgi:hypothetical protein
VLRSSRVPSRRAAVPVAPAPSPMLSQHSCTATPSDTYDRLDRYSSPVLRSSHVSSRRAQVAVALTPAHRARHPAGRPKPNAGGGGARTRHWYWMLAVLVRRHSPPAPTSTVGVDWHRRSSSPILQIYISSLSDVLEVCYNCFIWMLQK